MTFLPDALAALLVLLLVAVLLLLHSERRTRRDVRALLATAPPCDLPGCISTRHRIDDRLDQRWWQRARPAVAR